jgi:hypothetical protein
MNWKISTLLVVVLIILAGCAASTPTSSQDGKQLVEHAGAVAQPLVTVYKSPTCGCCSDWVEHMEEAGFTVEAHDVNDLASVKQENGVPGALHSCHTAIVDGYVIEGHVPAEDVTELLAERPEVIGLAVPGMPIGSPGMEIAGQPAQRFDVVSFDVNGTLDVFSSHNE